MLNSTLSTRSGRRTDRRRPRSHRSRFNLSARRQLWPLQASAVTDVADPTDVQRLSSSALLTNAVVQNGEIIEFILKPSRWSIALSSLRFIAAVTLVFVACSYFFTTPPLDRRSGVQLFFLLIVARLTWATLVWTSRFFILTNLRVIRASGVSSNTITSCPLRKINNIRSISSANERLMGLGTLEITSDGDCPIMIWQTLNIPKQIHERLAAAVARAKQNGGLR